MKNGSKLNQLNQQKATKRLGLLLVKTGVQAGTGLERPMRKVQPLEAKM